MKKVKIEQIIFLISFLLISPISLGVDNHFNKQIEILKNKGVSVYDLWGIVDNSRYCYRELNIIFKNNTIIAGTPLIPFLPSNNTRKIIEPIVTIIHQECF